MVVRTEKDFGLSVRSGPFFFLKKKKEIEKNQHTSLYSLVTFGTRVSRICKSCRLRNLAFASDLPCFSVVVVVKVVLVVV